jgi:hypothetical protein
MPEPHDLRFHEPFPAALRIALALGGMLTFLAPYELLIRPGIDELMLTTAPLWFISIAATAMGLSVVGLAVAGLTRTVLVDVYTRTIRVDMRGWFGVTHAWRHHFDRVTSVEMRREEDEGPPTFLIEAQLTTQKRPLLITRFQNETEANVCLARVRAVLRP